MQISLKDYGNRLMDKILVAVSQAEVKLHIDNLLGKMNQNNEDPDAIVGFLNGTIHQLENLTPMDKDASQWSNIKMARIHLQHIRRTFESIPCK